MPWAAAHSRTAAGLGTVRGTGRFRFRADAERSALTRLPCSTNSVNALRKVREFFLECPHRGAAEPRPVGNTLAGAWTAPWPACWTMSMSASRPADDPNAAATFVHGGLGLTPKRRGAQPRNYASTVPRSGGSVTLRPILGDCAWPVWRLRRSLIRPRTMLHLRADQSHHFYQFAGVGARATRCPLLIYQSNLRRRSLILT